MTPSLVVDILKSSAKEAHRYDRRINPIYFDNANKIGLKCPELDPAQRKTQRLLDNAKFYSICTLGEYYNLFNRGSTKADTKVRGLADFSQSLRTNSPRGK